jgi:hypothetical protein
MSLGLMPNGRNEAKAVEDYRTPKPRGPSRRLGQRASVLECGQSSAAFPPAPACAPTASVRISPPDPLDLPGASLPGGEAARR